MGVWGNGPSGVQGQSPWPSSSHIPMLVAPAMEKHRETLIASAGMLALLYALVLIWFPFLPNEAGRVSVDFSLWLPDMLAGYFWYLLTVRGDRAKRA